MSDAFFFLLFGLSGIDRASSIKNKWGVGGICSFGSFFFRGIMSNKPMKVRIGQKNMHLFMVLHGCAIGIGSPYDACSDVLVSLGYVKGSLSARKFCQKNADAILNRVNKPKEKGVGSTVRVVAKSRPKFDTGVMGDDFLKSYEWRKVRLIALKKYGPVCQCCGATPSTGAVMNVDHVKPRRFFPELALNVDNLQILCHECNHGKGNWDMTDWRPDALLKHSQSAFL